MKKLISVLVLFSLVACANAQQKEITECTNLGFKPDTEAFANCRLQIRSITAQRAAAFGVIAHH